MPSFSAEERQLLDDSLQGFLAENYSFERWKALARGPEMEGFGRPSGRGSPSSAGSVSHCRNRPVGPAAA